MPRTLITTLATYPTMREACDRLMALYPAYLKAHRHSETIEIMLASSSRPKGPDLIEVRAHHDSSPEHGAEVAWFAQALASPAPALLPRVSSPRRAFTPSR